MSAEPMTPAAAPSANVRPFYWSVRRELWENRAIYLAPLAVAAVTLFGFLISSFRLPQTVRKVAEAQALLATHPVDPKVVKAATRALHSAEIPYDMLTAFVFLTVIVVSIFYALGALHGERRDRSILFWKSLPVSDLTTVLSKAALPLLVGPVVVFAVSFCAHIVMLTWSALVMMLNGLPLTALTDHLPFPFLWLGLSRGLIVMALWYAPVIGWLLLVSGWARRMPILWAIGPWAALLILERLIFNSDVFYRALQGRLAGGFAQAFTVHADGETPIHTIADLNPLPVLANPNLWFGLFVFAGLIAAAVRLRRYRDPI